MTKLENLCERLTGVNPKMLEPRPSAQILEKWVREARKEKNSEFPLMHVSPGNPSSYALVETDTELGVDGHPNVPFSVVSRTLNGVTEHAFIWGASLRPDDVSLAAKHVPKSDWFKLNDNQRL